MKKIKYVIFILVILIVLVPKKDYSDVIHYNKKSYVLLDYRTDLFTYYPYLNCQCVENELHPINHDIFDFIDNEGDVYVSKKQYKKAINYYHNDQNYDWFIVDEDGLKQKISLTDEELTYIYNLNSMQSTKTMTFDDIQQFIDLVKISKDNFLKGTINFVYDGQAFYYKTEIMNDNDEELMIELSDSLNKKLLSLLNP